MHVISVIFNLAIQIATLLTVFQVGLQLGGVLWFWSRPSSETGACSSREPDGPRLEILERFPRLLCVAVS